MTNAQHTARLDYLKQKVIQLKRHLRFQTILELGRMPRPVIFQLDPAPLFAYEMSQTAVVAPQVEIPTAPPVAQTVVEVRETIDYEALAEQRRANERMQWENEMLAWNRQRMEMEDVAAHIFRSMEDDVEEVEVAIPVHVARDYTKSYFFSRLPTELDAMALSNRGWKAGCGLYNGDEEVEEREMRELERIRQIELDRLDRARIAEEERVAAAALAEKEREDERKAEKKSRALELKRILAFQKDLSRKREKEAQIERMNAENAAMHREELI
ncbi:hypothetical protein THRCLA_10497 [Thraustotheca clavata]|uniref:Uncharacterized protein n=1 Tax=Thraustotheca clavata TaxID=74557 RepID=A0A1V9YN09_9STRA|nr:hypothetical protein THRCLA_10497 [Thraustotheca clavata]